MDCLIIFLFCWLCLANQSTCECVRKVFTLLFTEWAESLNCFSLGKTPTTGRDARVMKAFWHHTFYMRAAVGTCQLFGFMPLLFISFLRVVFLCSFLSWVCPRVCVCFSFSFLIGLLHLPVCLPALCLLFCLYVCLSTCTCLSCLSAHPSLSLFIYLCLCVLIYLLCRPASGLRCFSFSVSVFLQLSEFLSLCKSLCPFLSFANTISHVYAYAVCACVFVCARTRGSTCFHRVHEPVCALCVGLFVFTTPTLCARVPELWVWIIAVLLFEVWNIFQRWNIFLFGEVIQLR